MTNANYIQWLETMIVGCDELGGMEREKAIYQNCLKKARNLGQNLPTDSQIEEMVNEIAYKQHHEEQADDFLEKLWIAKEHIAKWFKTKYDI